MFVPYITSQSVPRRGLPLVLERTFDIYRPTRWPTNWVLIVVLLCQCFMPSLVTVSCFGGRGKRTAWDMWKAYDEVTPAFCALAATPETVDNWLGPLERFVVLLYDRTSSQKCVNGARKQLFTQKGRAIDGLPPTQAVFLQHTKRAAYQAGHCWAQTMIATPELPSPSEWGWNKNENGGWKIYWTTLPEATQACRELLRCGCKKGCMGLCKCLKAGLQCTALCYCGGLCARS